MTTYARVAPIWSGETVVCIGGGPSLTVEDVNYVRGKARVLAINDAIKLAPWADLLYACDGRWWEMHKGVKSFTGPKYGMTVNTKKWPDVQKLRNDGLDGLCLDPTGLRTGRNSGYQSLNLCVHLGVRKILLLGFDMQRHGGKGHWFGDYKGWTPSPYQQFLQAFPTLVEPLKAKGVEVVNCTRVTALKTFPKMPIQDALPDVALEVAS